MRQAHLTDAIAGLTLAKLSEAAVQVQSDGADPYLPAYPHLRRHFAACDFGSDHDFVIAAHLVYAWMPRVLKLHFGGDDASLVEPARWVLAKAKTAPDQLAPEDYTVLAAPFNGSYVAPSKMLHFANPRHFAIWDSRVVKGIMRLADKPVVGQVGHHVMGKREHFVDYQNQLRTLAQEPAAAELRLAHLSAVEAVHHERDPPTPLRHLEYVLFALGAS